ncbi:serine hydrolase [Sphingopyxis sp.]|uniref:serine hydrolase n=1 Tax=Sphingopyxis sp. TaxID=1908224 RepID=UPI002ED802EC
MNRMKPSFAMLIALAAVGAPAQAFAKQREARPVEARAGIAAGRIDATVSRAMAAFDVPGMAVAIVKDGKLVHAKGYGVREAGKAEPVTPDTIFQIGSNTKAFTAAALAILVDEGKLKWDDRVIDHLPDFRMYDPYVTREFTIRDLLTHRSGLGPGAGDLMFVPATDMSRTEIMRGLRHLRPVSSFRSQYDYDNLLYVVAGEVVASASGRSWEDFIETRIMAPLGMTRCTASLGRVRDRSDVASPHVVIDGKAKPVAAVNMDVIGSAGTINCSLADMTRWLSTQLGEGRGPGGLRLFSPERSAEMWTMNVVTPPSPALDGLLRTHFSGYALGWGVSDSFGFKRVAHTGGVIGTVTSVAMIPELKLGVLVFTNQESGAAMQAVSNQILDAYIGAPQRDWVEIASAYAAGKAAEADATEKDVAARLAAAAAPTLPLDAYAGTFRDPWRGDAVVRREGGRLILKISRTASLEAELQPYSGNIFVARWVDRSINADAFVRFEQGFDGSVSGMKLQAISPATDFSFDFQDLAFERI